MQRKPRKPFKRSVVRPCAAGCGRSIWTKTKGHLVEARICIGCELRAERSRPT